MCSRKQAGRHIHKWENTLHEQVRNRQVHVFLLRNCTHYSDHPSNRWVSNLFNTHVWRNSISSGWSNFSSVGPRIIFWLDPRAKKKHSWNHSWRLIHSLHCMCSNINVTKMCTHYYGARVHFKLLLRQLISDAICTWKGCIFVRVLETKG
jgi:hypothetical protein